MIGIASLGPQNCNENIYPTDYTKVEFYLDFINNVLNKRLLNDMRVACYDEILISEGKAYDYRIKEDESCNDK